MAPQYHFSGLNFFGRRLNGVAGPVNDHQKRHRVRIPHHFPSNCDECEKLLEKFDDEVDDVCDDDDINRQQASAHVIFSHIFVLLDFVFVQRLQNKCTLQCLAFSPSIETDTLGAFS